MKDIKNFEGKYAITEDGQVYNYRLKRFMKLETCANGYQRIELSNNGKAERFFVHRLVAEAYLDNPNNYPIVNHKDYNPANNCVDNLEWCSYSYNNTYNDRAKKVAAMKSQKVKQMTMSGELIKVWDSAAEASRELGISSVYRAANGTRKSAGGFKWEYVKEVDKQWH